MHFSRLSSFLAIVTTIVVAAPLPEVQGLHTRDTLDTWIDCPQKAVAVNGTIDGHNVAACCNFLYGNWVRGGTIALSRHIGKTSEDAPFGQFECKHTDPGDSEPWKDQILDSNRQCKNGAQVWDKHTRACIIPYLIPCGDGQEC